jgi:hypothetical protein
MKRWALGLWVAFGVACDSEPPPREVPLSQVEDEVIAVVCDQMFICDCRNGRFYESKAQCQDTTRTLADQLRSIADMESLTWDPACLGRTLETIDDAGCDSAFDVGTVDECAPPCHYLHGSAGPGDACQINAQYVTDCDQGLECIGGTCAAPCTDDPNDMRGDVGEPCDFGCKDDLVCDADFLCRAAPKLGQNCDFGQCEEGLFCETADPNDPMTQLVCKAPVGIGEACRGHAQCESGFCPAGFCTDLPGEGDSCRGTFVCAAGLDCIEEVCVPGAPAVCEISVPLPGI